MNVNYRAAYAAALSVLACAAAEPLPRNAGFETPDAKGGAADWSLYGNGMWSVKRGEGRNGTSALICADVGKGGWTTQWVDLEPGRVYRIEGWVRTEDVEGSGVCIDFSWHDAYGTRLGTAATQPRVMGTTAWTKVSLEAFVPPAAAKRCLLGTPVTGNTKGKAWFDDLRIVPQELPPIGEFISDAYRNRAAEGPVTFHVGLGATKEEIAAKGLHGRFAVPSVASGTRIVAATPDRAEPRDVSATMDAASLPPGENKIVFELLDGKGKMVAAKSLVFTRTAKPETKGVRIDRRGITRIDGNPFFPLGMFMRKAEPEKIDHYAMGPFNCLMPYAPMGLSEKDLAMYRAAGLKVIFDLRHGTTDADGAEAWVRKTVAKFKDDPALLAWYTNDERPVSDIPKLAFRQRLLEEIDPDHPTWSVQDVFSEARQYMGTYDVLGMDPYPIPKKPIETAISSMRQGLEGTFGARAVWQVPQAFGWGWLKRKETKGQRAPTQKEMANMTWQAIAGGANGIVYYAFQHLYEKHDDPADAFAPAWARTKAAACEVKKYEQVLLSDEKPVAVAGATEAVAVRTWRHKGDTYLLAVNCTASPQTAKLALQERVGKVVSADFGPMPKIEGPAIDLSFGPIDYVMLRFAAQ